jgi:hypothetical protein
VQNHTICVQNQLTKLDMNKSNFFVLQYFSISYKQASVYEEGASGTEAGRKDDSLTSYREKGPMTPAKIKEYEYCYKERNDRKDYRTRTDCNKS